MVEAVQWASGGVGRKWQGNINFSVKRTFSKFTGENDEWGVVDVVRDKKRALGGDGGMTFFRQNSLKWKKLLLQIF